jgi:hypothetical protein
LVDVVARMIGSYWTFFSKRNQTSSIWALQKCVSERVSLR